MGQGLARGTWLFAGLILLALARPAAAQPQFTRADCNGDETVNIADAVAMLSYLFGGGAVGCQLACDANDDGAVQLSDAIYTLSFIFSGGAAPAAPFPDCGSDPTPSALSCVIPPCTSPGPSANLREVDVAYLGVAPSGNGQLVSVTGSGAQHQLTSWSLAAGDGQPTAQVTTAAIDGHHARVNALTGALVAAGQPRFVTGRIVADGNVFLSSRQLNAAGAFTHHGTIGYGDNANVEVLSYDLAVRLIYSGFFVSHYQIVTPVVVEPTAGGPMALRLVSWQVNATTGAITGLEDSGNLPLAFPQSLTPDEIAVTVSHLQGIQYVLTYTNDSNHLENRFFWVEDDGAIVYTGGASGGEDIRGDNFLQIDQEANAVAAVTASGYITANRDLDGELVMNVWERRAEGVLNYEPYQISDSTRDLVPDAAGVFLPVPSLTDSWSYPLAAGDLAGRTVAVGDFNGDGYDDAIIGAPYRDNSTDDNVGAIYVIHGDSTGGITGNEYTQVWSQSTSGIDGVGETQDRFGEALAVGDFDGDGNDDLAIGVPYEDVGALSSGGAVNIIYGTPFGLSSGDNFIITQEDLGQTTAASDYFGFALASGDFDNDGRDDLAISAYGREVGGHPNGGVVYVVWGTAGGLTMSGSTLLHQDSTGIFDTVEDFDEFGRVLAAGDFDGDSQSDLVIGVPREDVGAAVNAGGVHILYGNSGSSTGFSGNNFISQGGFDGGADILGAVEASDLFGSAFAVGDFDDDGAEDLAIGVPGEAVGALASAGAVNVLYGTFLGLTQFGNTIITLNEFDPLAGSLPSSSEADDEFGFSLAGGDFDGDGYADLAVGAPGKNIPSTCSNPAVTNAGAVFTIFGTSTGLTPSGSSFHHQNACDAEFVANGSAATGDQYGYSVSAGDFNADGEDDLIVGIPSKDYNDDNVNSGAIHILPGSSGGLDYSVDEEWFVRTRQIVRAMVSDLTWEAAGEGNGQLYAESQFLDPLHVASVTKCMTLLLAVEAIEAGDVSLSDSVWVSSLAGTTGGSFLEVWDSGSPVLDMNGDEIRFIQTGDTMPLELLLHGMMMRSCNRSSVAIGEWVALQVEGNPDLFVNMMNERAVELGMTETICGHPAGGMITDPQDLITLIREGSQHPLFMQIASRELYGDVLPALELCGTDAFGLPKCNGEFPKHQTIGDYPGRQAQKGGNGGLWWGSQPASGIPWCTSSAVAIVERADRALAISLQQTGDRTGDSQDLFDHGFRKVFTPDGRAELSFPTTGGIIGPDGPVRVRAFALDTIANDACVTAVIDDFEELRINVWSTDPGTGDFYALSSASETYVLTDGTTYASSPLVRIARIPAGAAAIGDYVTANLDGEHLDLKLWRVGETP
ncbi:MAG: hypothetical protein ACKVX7_18335 [Planctomycetota bacterium]